MAIIYDLVVIGTGTFGAATCYQASKLGLNCLGIDQFDPPHSKGSHNGQTRIIRESYFELPDYVPLLQEAYKGWATIEEEYGKKLLHQSGMLYLGEPGSFLIDGVRKSALEYDLDVPTLAPDVLTQKYPQFFFPEKMETIYEDKAGYLEAGNCIHAMLSIAEKNGATLKSNTKVISWELRNDHVVVFTATESYKAKRIIITAGAYARNLVPALNKKVEVSRQHIFWFEPKQKDLFTIDKFACWNVEDPDYPGLFYGFPYAERGEEGQPWGMKIAHHIPGTIVATPTEHSGGIEKELTEATKVISAILKKYMPQAAGPLLHSETCFYANTPDQHFIIDYLPHTEEKVVVAAGFSGHGFKFAPTVGSLLVEYAQSKPSSLPIDFLKFERFSQ